MRAAVVLFVVLACGPQPRPLVKRRITDENAAIFAFQTAWARDVRPRIADPWVRRVDNRMQDLDAIDAPYSAAQYPCRDGIARIQFLETVRMSADEPESGIVVYGGVDALLGRDRCWSVMFLGGRRNLDAEGWLDLNGRLLIAWRIPAGA